MSPDVSQSLRELRHSLMPGTYTSSGNLGICVAARTGILSCGGLEMPAILKMSDHVANGVEMSVAPWKRTVPRARKELRVNSGKTVFHQNGFQVFVRPGLEDTIPEPTRVSIIVQVWVHGTYRHLGVFWPLLSCSGEYFDFCSRVSLGLSSTSYSSFMFVGKSIDFLSGTRLWNVGPGTDFEAVPRWFEILEIG